VIPPFNSAF